MSALKRKPSFQDRLQCRRVRNGWDSHCHAVSKFKVDCVDTQFTERLRGMIGLAGGGRPCRTKV